MTIKTYHIHIRGIVQGVGFRPFVYKKAVAAGLNGTVQNGNDGVHIFFNASKENALQFKNKLYHSAPAKSVITGITLKELLYKSFTGFKIIESDDKEKKTVRLTPDYALCSQCAEDIDDKKNKRYHYPFTTCTDCGPRFSIIELLPYDRHKTSMNGFEMCPACKTEYEEILDRRYYSQTNSCPHCAITLSMQKSDGQWIKGSQNDFIQRTVEAWTRGKIVAVKGIGGYLITSDATNPDVIRRLRQLKHRPNKPFAVMYHDFLLMAEDVDVDAASMLELKDPAAPIVLLHKKTDSWSGIAYEDIAPSINKLGVMLPYTPLYKLLLDLFGKPIVATSANLSGDPIEYKNGQAFENLNSLVDLFLHNDRPIVVPQDDSVIAQTPLKRQRLILRRSRGLAPTYISDYDRKINKCVVSMGGLLKSTFGITAHGNIYISQSLGDTDSYNTQENYQIVLKHFLKLFELEPEAVIIDKHPSFFSSMVGEQIAEEKSLPLIKVQHHEAHFYAILGEHGLLKSKEEILGVVWDGTGLGDDQQIWGGEFFKYKNGSVTRLDHLPYFSLLAGDKMAREPRISALSLLQEKDEKDVLLKHRFSDEEWDIYMQILQKNTAVKCSSMGRFFDGMAALILDLDYQTYEGEAAMRLENAADNYFRNHLPGLGLSYLENENGSDEIFNKIILSVVSDMMKQVSKELVAARFHVSLADYIARIADKYNIKKLAFSGGVFQNAWLIDLIQLFLNKDHALYFHQAFSPNDENISYGQLMYYYQNIHNEIS